MSKFPTLMLGATSAVIYFAPALGDDVALAHPAHSRCYYGCVAPSRVVIERRTAYAPPIDYVWGWPYGYGFGGPATFHFPPVRSWGQGLGGFGPGW